MLRRALEFATSLPEPGPFLQTGKWHDVGLSLSEDNGAGGKIRVYLNGALVKQAVESSIPASDAPFQIGGRGLEASFPESKALYDRVVFYDGVLEPRDFVRLTRRGGPPLSVRPTVVEPLAAHFLVECRRGDRPRIRL